MKDHVVTDAQKEACKRIVVEVVAFFGSNALALQVLGYKSRQTFQGWVNRGGIPADAAWKIQGLSAGHFKAVEISDEAKTQFEIRETQLHMAGLVKRLAS